MRPGKFRLPTLLVNKAQSRCGSISIFVLLLMPPLLLMLGSVLKVCEARREDTVNARYIHAAAEYSLASFDRKLQREYGLWAADPQKVDFKVLGKLECKSKAMTVKLKAVQGLGQNEVLKNQILRQMKWRAPFLLGKEVMERILNPLLQKNESLKLRTESELSRFSVQDQKVKLQQALQKPELIKKAEADGEGAWAFKLLDMLFREYLIDIIPVYEATGLNVVDEEVLDPGKINQFGDFSDRILSADGAKTYDFLCLSEYALAYFPAKVSVEIDQGKQISLKRPDGVTMESLGKERRSEVERIISGEKTAEKAEKFCRSRILAIRFAVNLASKLTDQEGRTAYRLKAALISAAITVLSLGEITIPAESIEYLLICSDSLRDSKKDYEKLALGELLPFWPKQRTIVLAYRDYLRFLLMATPEKKILSQIQNLIKEQIPGELMTSFKLEIQLGGRQFEWPFAYQDHQSPADAKR